MKTKPRFWSFALLIALAIATLLGNGAVQVNAAPSDTPVTAITTFTFLSTPRLGETAEVIMTSTASHPSAQVTLEDTRPLEITPKVYGAWSGLTGTGGISQKTTLSFTESGLHHIVGFVKVELDGQTAFSPVDFAFEVAPQATPTRKWSIDTSKCATSTTAFDLYSCSLKITVGLVPTVANSLVYFKAMRAGQSETSFLLRLDEVDSNGQLSVTALGGNLPLGTSQIAFKVVQTSPNNDALVLTSASVNVTASWAANSIFVTTVDR